MRLTTIQKNIINLIEKEPILADSDRLLYIAYLKFEGYEINENAILEGTHFETIRRNRQILSEQGFIKSRKRTKELRDRKEIKVRNEVLTQSKIFGIPSY